MSELDYEFPVLVEQLSVHSDLTARTEIAHHVPVNGGEIRAARLGNARTQSHVERAEDLLVEERVAHEPGHALVRSDRELARDARAGIDVQRLDEEILSFVRLRLDHAALLEPQPDVRDLATAIHRGVCVANLPFDGPFDRAREDLAVRHVRLSRAIDEGTSRDAEAKIGVR